MSYYVKCSGCCERYELAEGSLQYKLYKERRTKFLDAKNVIIMFD